MMIKYLFPIVMLIASNNGDASTDRKQIISDYIDAKVICLSSYARIKGLSLSKFDSILNIALPTIKQELKKIGNYKDEEIERNVRSLTYIVWTVPMLEVFKIYENCKENGLIDN